MDTGGGSRPRGSVRVQRIVAFGCVLALAASVTIAPGAAVAAPDRRLVSPAGAAAGVRLLSLPSVGAKSAARSGGLADGALYVPGEVIVQLAATRGITSASSAVHAVAGAESVTRLGDAPGMVLVRLQKGVSVDDAVKAYEAQDGVKLAQPNYIRRVAAVTPNDPMYPQLWGLNNTGQTGGTYDADIDAPEAWGVETGSDDVVVAVVDTGIDYTHPELAANIWTNPGEIPGNGVDDDGNGYIDDIHGIDAYNGDADPMDDNGHGTHVAGTIGGAGNNALGVTGVNWDVSLMAVKIIGAGGSGTDAAAIEGIEYANMMGADVINCSWGSTGGSQGDALGTAIASSKALVVCAAGNSGVNIETTPFYPASYTVPNILTVAATTSNDQKASFSNYGSVSADVFAPGEVITSTIPGQPLWQLVRSDGMGSLIDWNLYGSPPWAYTAARYTSPSGSAGNNWYANDMYSWMYSKVPINLGGYTRAKVRFNYWYALESGWDYFNIAVSNDDTTYTLIGQGTGTTGGWYTTDLPADQIAGDPSGYLAFILDTDGSVSGYEGVYVDDVEVYGANSVQYGDAYAAYSGTSMAAPHVSGVAALVKAASPGLDAAGIKSAILANVDKKAALYGLVKTGGRVNAYAAVAAAAKLTVGTPKAPSTMRHTRFYTVYGYIWPQHQAGGFYDVHIYKWKKTSSGRWKSYGFVDTVLSNYSTHTKYRTYMKLSTAGKWKLRAYAPADEHHAGTWSSSYDYVTVY